METDVDHCHRTEADRVTALLGECRCERRGSLCKLEGLMTNNCAEVVKDACDHVLQRVEIRWCSSPRLGKN